MWNIFNIYYKVAYRLYYIDTEFNIGIFKYNKNIKNRVERSGQQDVYFKLYEKYYGVELLTKGLFFGFGKRGSLKEKLKNLLNNNLFYTTNYFHRFGEANILSFYVDKFVIDNEAFIYFNFNFLKYFNRWCYTKSAKTTSKKGYRGEYGFKIHTDLLIFLYKRPYGLRLTFTKNVKTILNNLLTNLRITLLYIVGIKKEKIVKVRRDNFIGIVKKVGKIDMFKKLNYVYIDVINIEDEYDIRRYTINEIFFK